MALLNQIYEKRDDADSAVLPPKDSFYYALLSTVFFGSGKFELARFSLLQALRLAQQENRGYGVEGLLLHNLAMASLQVRDLPSAQEWQRRCLGALGRSPVCWLRYGEICWQRARTAREAREARGAGALGDVVWRGNPFALMNGVLGADWRPGEDGTAGIPMGNPMGKQTENPTGKPSEKPSGKPSGKQTEKLMGKPATQSEKPLGKQSGKPLGKPSTASAKPSPQLGNAQPTKSSTISTISTQSSRGEQSLLQ